MRTSPPTIAASWRAPASFVRSVRPMHSRSGRSQNVSPPSTVPGASIRPSVGMPARRASSASRTSGSPARFGLPGAERDRAAVGDEQRVEDVDEVRVVGLGVEDVDARPEAVERVDEAVVLAARGSRSTGRRKPCAGSSKARAERRTRRLDEHLAQRRGHALARRTARPGRRSSSSRRGYGRGSARRVGSTRGGTRAADRPMHQPPQPQRGPPIDRDRRPAGSAAPSLAAAILVAPSSPPSADGRVAVGAPRAAHRRRRWRPPLTASTIELTPVVERPRPAPCSSRARSDGTGRLFIVEQTGRIRVRQGRRRSSSTPFLDISGSVSNGGEQGLLGLAFHPSFKTNRKFYVDYTNTRRRHGRPRVPASTVEPEPRGRRARRDAPARSTSRTPTTTAACSRSGPTATCTSAWATAATAATPATGPRTSNSLLGKMLRIDVNGTTATQGLPRSRRRTRTSARPGATRSGSAACATRGASRSTARPATCGSATSARAATRRSTARSTTSTGPGEAATGAGASWRAATATSRRRAATRPARRCRCSSTRTRRTAAAPSPAATCTAAAAIPALVGWYVFGDYCSGEIWAIRGDAPARRRG